MLRPNRTVRPIAQLLLSALLLRVLLPTDALARTDRLGALDLALRSKDSTMMRLDIAQ
jgi:hypothetical protein